MSTAQPAPFRLEGPFPPAPKCADVGALYPNTCFCSGRRYTCPGCRRFVPWCFGSADEHAELCDDCACVARDRDASATETQAPSTCGAAT